MIFKEKTRSIPITKHMVWDAYKLVKKNKGGAGYDCTLRNRAPSETVVRCNYKTFFVGWINSPCRKD